MKINTHIVSTGLLFGFIYLLFLQWSNSSFKSLNDKNYSPKAIGNINAKYKTDFGEFVKSTLDFRVATEDFIHQKKSTEDLINDYRILRDKFKTVEFIIEYLDKEAFDKIINGAPLPKLEKKVADITVLQPHGFQVIDEIIASEGLSTLEIKEELIREAKTLERNVNEFHSFLKARKITDRQFFEAARMGIIRLATLGTTGFDTPGTLQGIEDAKVVLNHLKIYLNLYKPELKNVERTDLLKSSNKIFKRGLKLTKNEDFDNFNRLIFIKEFINPAYKVIKDIHLALSYETIDEVSRFIQAVNYKSDNIFNPDFLNSFFYVSLQNDSTYNAKAELGKLLFYDPILSKNNEMSCASCHNPKKAFTDGKTLSLSNAGSPMKRNAMTLNYSVYAILYFHDLRAKNLENQFEHVVVSEDEFNTSYKEIIDKVNQSSNYKSLFEKAFPDIKARKIRSNDIDYVLAAYVMKLNTFDSPIDKFFQNKIAELPESVERGFNLFAGKAACATCHFVPLFSGNLPPLFMDTEAEVLGVPEDKEEPWSLDDDPGRLGNGVTLDKAKFYRAAFKTPTIRNIELTGPYMHNGVFDTLEEVMDFYNKGGGAGGGINLEHQTLASDPLNLTDREIEDIIAFMKALTDTKKFQQPEDLPRDFENENINKRSF
ncbi:cytochrome c peroxidase [Winogradskyella sp.]|uniref:cytochrome-c peroxidase n=1 Tax=Winogradskyella sp. TaxID=1883156 RepID=UPI00260418B6|nr:cytochrome c peroxidase [Winogradskyella sp.]